MQGGGERSPGRPVRVVLIDDSEPLLDTLLAALGLQSGVEVVGTAVDAEQAAATVRDLQPDVVLLDLRLGSTWGLDLVPVLRSGSAPPAIVVFSTASDPVTLGAVSRASVDAHVSKGAPIDEIAAALVGAGTQARGSRTRADG